MEVCKLAAKPHQEALTKIEYDNQLKLDKKYPTINVVLKYILILHLANMQEQYWRQLLRFYLFPKRTPSTPQLEQEHGKNDVSQT